MTTTEMIRQRAYRARRTERFSRMRSALTTVITKLEGNDKPLANELRKIAEEGLS